MGLAIAAFSCEKEEVPSNLRYAISDSVLTLRSAYPMSEVEMYNDIGQSVYKRDFEGNDRFYEIPIDVSNLSIGTYTITVIGEITETIRVLIY